jgi:hypothetical protein
MIDYVMFTCFWDCLRASRNEQYQPAGDHPAQYNCRQAAAGRVIRGPRGGWT